MRTNQRRQAQHSQRGMASIVITMVTMVVISLIVLGFATISRREQRQSLDQLLSTQAFYAAESGVEDARNIIRQRLANGQPVIGKDNCTTNNAGGNYPTAGQTRVDTGYDVSYSCLLVDPAPSTVAFDGVDSNNIVLPLTTAQPITSLEVIWRPTTAPSGTPLSCPNGISNAFTPQPNWQCGYGILRAELVPTSGGLSRNGLRTSSLSGFFVPTRNAAAGTLAYAGNTGRANVVAANCQTGAYVECRARITGITGGATSVSLRLSSMYQPSNVSVQAFNNATSQDISGIQAEVDVTGRASDVLRRINVRVPIAQTGGLLPGYALQTNGSLCKRFSTTANYFSIPADIVDADTDNDMCVVRNDGTP